MQLSNIASSLSYIASSPTSKICRYNISILKIYKIGVINFRKNSSSKDREVSKVNVLSFKMIQKYDIQYIFQWAKHIKIKAIGLEMCNIVIFMGVQIRYMLIPAYHQQ